VNRRQQHQQQRQQQQHQAVDAYAQQILEKYASSADPDGSSELVPHIDDSLGPYVTNSLRESGHGVGGGGGVALDDLPEYDALAELLQEQCGLSASQAKEALQEIATAVFPPPLNSVTSADATLLPVNLLEEDSADYYSARKQPLASSTEDHPTADLNDEEAFPSLQSSAKSSPVLQPTKKPPKGGRKKTSREERQAVEEDLAASLFQTRSRPNSIDETRSAHTSPKLSPNLQPQPLPPAPHSAPVNLGPYAGYDQYTAAQEEADFLQQNLHVTAEVLCATFAELSPEAAYAAAVQGGGDYQYAQSVIHAALTSVPVCRHLLADGCYRADCQFSHDVAGHTCSFWLRGRCGKGGACRFLHGFKEAECAENGYEETGAVGYGGVEAAGMYGGYPADSEEATYHQGDNYYYDSYEPSYPPPTSVAPVHGLSSFANIASTGYNVNQSFATAPTPAKATPVSITSLPTTKIPQDLWNPSEYRDVSAFHIADPMERYWFVASSHSHREDVIDLHFQSLKTFNVVLDTVLPDKLSRMAEVWIVTGTGHHVARGHQKGGGVLEDAVLEYLLQRGTYAVYRGRDRAGHGGAVLVRFRGR
jgi:hypothetical protein